MANKYIFWGAVFLMIGIAVFLMKPFAIVDIQGYSGDNCVGKTNTVFWNETATSASSSVTLNVDIELEAGHSCSANLQNTKANIWAKNQQTSTWDLIYSHTFRNGYDFSDMAISNADLIASSCSPTTIDCYSCTACKQCATINRKQCNYDVINLNSNYIRDGTIVELKATLSSDGGTNYGFALQGVNPSWTISQTGNDGESGGGGGADNDNIVRPIWDNSDDESIASTGSKTIPNMISDFVQSIINFIKGIFK